MSAATCGNIAPGYRCAHPAFSGITVGLVGAAIGIHWSLGLSAAVLLALLGLLLRRATRPA